MTSNSENSAHIDESRRPTQQALQVIHPLRASEGGRVQHKIPENWTVNGIKFDASLLFLIPHIPIILNELVSRHILEN